MPFHNYIIELHRDNNVTWLNKAQFGTSEIIMELFKLRSKNRTMHKF